jgi:hypothetical protein
VLGRLANIKRDAGGGVYSWYPETSGVVDGTLEGDAGDEDAVGSIDSVAFADVQAQRLAGPLDDFHEMYRILWILQKEKKRRRAITITRGDSKPK